MSFRPGKILGRKPRAAASRGWRRPDADRGFAEQTIACITPDKRKRQFNEWGNVGLKLIALLTEARPLQFKHGHKEGHAMNTWRLKVGFAGLVLLGAQLASATQLPPPPSDGQPESLNVRYARPPAH
jgi:hypothetical protein